MFSKLVGAGKWIQRRTGPVYLDPHQAKRQLDPTVNLYKAAGRDFTAWVRKHGLIIDGPEECDDILVEWKNAPDGRCTCSAPSPSHFSQAIAFVEWVYPQWKGKLNWPHTVHNAWQRFVPIKHTIPCPRFLALVVGLDMMREGDVRGGAGFILAQRYGWRPSEVAGIRGSDVSLPGEGWDDGVIALGVGRGTKSRREEFTHISQDHKIEMELLRRIKETTPDDEYNIWRYG